MFFRSVCVTLWKCAVGVCWSKRTKQIDSYSDLVQQLPCHYNSLLVACRKRWIWGICDIEQALPALLGPILGSEQPICQYEYLFLPGDDAHSFSNHLFWWPLCLQTSRLLLIKLKRGTIKQWEGKRKKETVCLWISERQHIIVYVEEQASKETSSTSDDTSGGGKVWQLHFSSNLQLLHSLLLPSQGQ